MKEAIVAVWEAMPSRRQAIGCAVIVAGGLAFSHYRCAVGPSDRREQRRKRFLIPRKRFIKSLFLKRAASGSMKL